MVKKKNIISSAAFIAAALFLFTPNINIIDLIPDFIAYLILYNSLSKVSDLIPHFDDARDRFHKLFWITLSKIPAAFIMLSISSQNTAERPIIAVFSLSYAILELIYIYPAFSALFDGFDYLEERFGADDKGKKRHVAPRKFTAIFFSVKMICCTVPEFSLTSVSDILGDVTYRPNIAKFYPYFAVLGGIIALVFGIIWLTKFIRFCRHVCASRHIEFSLSSSYIEKRARLNQIHCYRLVCLCMSLLMIATVFGLDLFLDDKNYLPDIFSALLFVAASLVMRKFTPRAKLPVIFGLIYALSNVFTTLSQKSFISSYEYSDIFNMIAADKAYDIVITASLIECALSIVVFFTVAHCISALVKDNTGSTSTSENALKYNAELHKKFSVQAYIMASLGTLASLSTVLYNYLLCYTEKVEMIPEYSTDAMTMSKYGEFWIVVALLDIVWIIYTYRTSSAIKESAEQKFEIDF